MSMTLDPAIRLQEKNNFLQVLSYLSVQDLGQSCCVSTAWNKIVGQDCIWRERFSILEFPLDKTAKQYTDGLCWVHSFEEIAQCFQEFASKVSREQLGTFSCYSTCLSRNFVDVQFSWRWATQSKATSELACLKAVYIFGKELKDDGQNIKEEDVSRTRWVEAETCFLVCQKIHIELSPDTKLKPVERKKETQDLFGEETFSSENRGLKEEVLKILDEREAELADKLYKSLC